jgi:hypothetical protein
MSASAFSFDAIDDGFYGNYDGLDNITYCLGPVNSSYHSIGFLLIW